ncbi:hypothetical protein ABK040_006129 [Willaertia magna]
MNQNSCRVCGNNPHPTDCATCCSTHIQEQTPIPSKLDHPVYNNNDEKEVARTQHLLEQALLALIQKHANEKPISSSPPVPTQVTLATQLHINTPIQIQEMMAMSGYKKSKETLDQMIILSLLSGIFVGFGGVASLKTGGNCPGWEATNPGFTKLIFSAVFTVGLIMVIAAGTELFTSNSMAMTVAMLRRKVSVWDVVKNLTISLTFNLIGGYLVCYFLMYLPTSEKELKTAGFVAYAKKVGETKVSRTIGQTILLGIGCNWLVCMAVYVTYASNVLVDKIIGLAMPIIAFVAGGFEHSVANGFFIPLAMLYGSDITMYEFICINLLPATLGNFIGGAVFVGMVFWYTHGVRQENNSVLDDLFLNKAKSKTTGPFISLYEKIFKKNSQEDKSSTSNNLEMQDQGPMASGATITEKVQNKV